MRNLIILVFVSILLYGCTTNLKISEYGSTKDQKKVLIAGESTEFKDKVNKLIIDELQKSGCYIKVVGLTEIINQNEHLYDVILLENTCWAWELDKSVKNFLKKNPKNPKVIVFTTVGGEDWKPEIEIDAVTSASTLDKVDKRADEILALIKKRLQKQD